MRLYNQDKAEVTFIEYYKEYLIKKEKAKGEIKRMKNLKTYINLRKYIDYDNSKVFALNHAEDILNNKIWVDE